MNEEFFAGDGDEAAGREKIGGRKVVQKQTEAQ
jgi:hypothetical protein